MFPVLHVIYLGPVPNGTLYVHLLACGLTMGAVCLCRLNPQDCRVSVQTQKKCTSRDANILLKPKMTNGTPYDHVDLMNKTISV